MILRVEGYAGHRGEAPPPRRFLDHRALAPLDCWLAPDHRCFQLRGADGATCLLRHDAPRGRWRLRLYQAPPRAAGPRAGPPA